MSELLLIQVSAHNYEGFGLDMRHNWRPKSVYADGGSPGINSFVMIEFDCKTCGRTEMRTVQKEPET